MTSELVPWRGHTVPVLSQTEISRYNLSDYIRMITDGGYGLHSPIPVQTTYGRQAQEPIANNFQGFVEGLLYSDGPVAAAEAYRLRVFGQAPMLYQEMEDGRPGDFFDDDRLDLLRKPWPSGTLLDLMKRALIHGDLAGNAFGAVIEDEIVLLRPDWVKIVLERRMYGGVHVGWRQVGIAYAENGVFSAELSDPEIATFLPGEYFHFVPGLPDPLATYRGLSWLTPVVREVMADKAAIQHKLKYFENSASPNLAVKTPAQMTPTQFKAFVEMMREQHDGLQNAGKTLYLGDGADVTVIGGDMRQMDFTAVSGKGETRVANAAGVPPVLLSFSEGMQGSSLNAGNYQAAKRSFVDTTMRELWANWCGTLQSLDGLKPGPKTRLWYDPRDIPFLHEDAKDVASIQQTQATTINNYVREGWKPETALAAVKDNDLTKLEHTGNLSVQLQAPGSHDSDGDGVADSFADDAAEEDAAEDAYLEALNAARSELDDFDDWIARGEEDEDDLERARYNIRRPKGVEGGGRFRKISEVIFQALEEWMNGDGDEDPLEPFEREQLRQAAKQLDIPLPRGVSKPVLKKLLLDKATADVRAQRGDKPDVPDAPEKDAKPDVDRVFAAGDREQAERILSRLTQSEFESGVADPSRSRKELVDASRLLGLPTSGTKDALRKRLVDRAAELRKGDKAPDAPESPAVAKVQAAKKGAPRKPAKPRPSDYVHVSDVDTVMSGYGISEPRSRQARDALAEAQEMLQSGDSRADVANVLRQKAEDIGDLTDADVYDPRDAPREKLPAELREIADADFDALWSLADALAAIDNAAEKATSAPKATSAKKGTPRKPKAPTASSPDAKAPAPTPATPAAPTFSAEDTITINGQRGTAIVDEVKPDGRLVVTVTKRLNRTDTRIDTFTVSPDRVSLVRKGNKEEDLANLFAQGHDLNEAMRLADAKHRQELAAAKKAVAGAQAAPKEGRLTLSPRQRELLAKASKNDVIDVDKSDPDVQALVAAGYIDLDPRSNRAEINGRGALKAKLLRLDAPAKKATPRKATPRVPKEAPADVDKRVRDAYASLPKSDTGFVSIADIRDRLGDLSREDQDAALRRLATSPDAEVIPIANAKSIAPRFGNDPRIRDAGIVIGGEEQHVIRIGGSASRSADTDEDDLIRSAADLDEYDDDGDLTDGDEEESEDDDEFDEEVEAAVEAVDWPDDEDDDEAERSGTLDDDIARADREQLHHYWTRGKGLAKWATTMHGAWTRLYRHLRKHVGSERAKRMAAQWHKEVFGIWPGEKAGSNPVGPG